MTSTKTFHLGDILSVTTHRVLSPDGIDGVQAFLNFLTGDDLASHQMIRATRECETVLLARYPALAGVQVPAQFGSEAAVYEWLARQTAVYGEYFEVAPLDDGDHTHIHPMAELRMMKPDVDVIDLYPGAED